MKRSTRAWTASRRHHGSFDGQPGHQLADLPRLPGAGTGRALHLRGGGLSASGTASCPPRTSSLSRTGRARPAGPGPQDARDPARPARHLPPDGHPAHRDQLTRRERPAEDDNSPASQLAKSLRLFAKLPTVVALDQRRRHGQEPHRPRPTSVRGELPHMCFGEVPEPESSAFEISLILYAEHSFNASTFTARVVTSTLSDLYSAVTARDRRAEGAAARRRQRGRDAHDATRSATRTKPPLAARRPGREADDHGLRPPRLQERRLPRAHDAHALEQMAAPRRADRCWTIYEVLEPRHVRGQGHPPEPRLPGGPGLPPDGLRHRRCSRRSSSCSRITGWTAHIIEQLGANSLIRPLAAYTGVDERHLS